jgi:hypothetical protein
MGFDLTFYLIDHRLIALAMVALLAVVCEVGFRAGARKRDASETFRSLMSGIGAAMFGLLALLLGGGFGRVFKVGNQPMFFNTQAFYNVARPTDAPEWQLQFAIAFMFPR